MEVGGTTGCGAVSEVLLALGGGKPKLRDLVYVFTKNWNLAVEDIVVKMGETSRKLSPVEHGRVAMVRRIARLRLGLTAVDEQTAIPTWRRICFRWSFSR